MENIQALLESIATLFTSEKVAYIINLITVVYFGVSKVVVNVKSKALEIKAKTYASDIEKSQEILSATNAQLQQALSLMAQMKVIVDKQSEALQLAFKSSNLKDSAKEVISSILSNAAEVKNEVEDLKIPEEVVPTYEVNEEKDTLVRL